MIDPYPGQFVTFKNDEGGLVTAEVISIKLDQACTAWNWRAVRLRFNDKRCHAHGELYRDLYMWAVIKSRVK